MKLFGAGAFLIVLFCFLVIRWPPEDGWEARKIERETVNYNLKFVGDWTEFEKMSAINAAHQIGLKMARVQGLNISAADMFSCFYGLSDYQPMEIEKILNEKRYVGAEVLDTHHVRFYGAYSPNRFNDADKRTERLFTHEFGHAAEDRILEIVSVKVPRRVLFWAQVQNHLFPMRGRCTSLMCGFAGGIDDWQFNLDESPGEEFADMFVGWAYSNWENSPDGAARNNFMNTHMESWISMGCTKNLK